MKVRSLYVLALAITTALVIAACGSGGPDEGAPATSYSPQVNGYLVTAPTEIQSGRTQNFSVSLFNGEEPARGTVHMALSQRGSDRPIAKTTESVPGSGPVPLDVPAITQGSYLLSIKVEGDEGGEFTDSAEVQVRTPQTVLFLETDKPIYKPGQQVHVRALQMDTDLMPVPGPVTLEVQDAKGIKVFKRTVEADRFGMAETGLPLSTEPNLGVWKLTATSGEQSTQLDVRVETYVLPKYEITVDLPKEWVLPDDPIVGTVAAEYSFGKPVRGEVEIAASRYVGYWEEYARFTKDIDGETAFEVPTPSYMAGTPAAGGQGNVQLEVTVREQSTG